METNDVVANVQNSEEEAEEALSLCDLPISASETSGKDFSPCGRRSTSEPPELFEFFSDLSYEMSPADEIIFCGKLVPFKDAQTRELQDNKQGSVQKGSALRRRSESLSELQTSRSNSAKSRLVRNSRSLDYRKLYRSSSSQTSPGPEMDRNSSDKSSGRSDISVRKVPKSRWYLLMFGLVKFPPEMELRDIKSRQVRRSPSTLFPSLDASVKVPVKRSSGKCSWGILRALSCKDASVAVTASFHCIPRA
ncbi:uncharacterized protein LOC117925345 [Vitis riparia]|uniref:uncharacterized protein LOC117925345 n=1 Tax=Vitis riparia TaxID=96939 RepID=UPI00155B32FF|nr:uncharacterized protein LOC117925345 [Vitis riparia]